MKLLIKQITSHPINVHDSMLVKLVMKKMLQIIPTTWLYMLIITAQFTIQYLLWLHVTEIPSYDANLGLT